MYLDEEVNLLYLELDDLVLTPITHIRVDAIRAFVMRNGIHISISPAACFNRFVLIVGGFDFELLEKGRESTHSFCEWVRTERDAGE